MEGIVTAAASWKTLKKIDAHTLSCYVDLSAILVAAWPVSLLVMLIFNSLWGKHARTFWFCSGFIIGLLFLLCWILRAYAIWKLMWLSIPAAAIVWFSCRIHRE